MVSVLEKEVFLSEILGRKVYLQTQFVGRLDDFVILETGKFPEVSQLVVRRSFGYPSLLVPWDKVTLISNTELVLDLTTPQGHEQPVPEGAILLKGHILDKKILDMDDHEVEVVYDIKLVFQQGKFYASEVDFSHNRLLRRMGLGALAKMLARQQERSTVSWLYVQPLPEKLGVFKGHVKLSVLKENIHDIHPVDLADILEELEGDQRLAVFNELEPSLASDTLEEVEPRVQRELMRSIHRGRAAQLIKEMSPGQAADLLAILPSSEVDELLPLIDQDDAAKVQQIVDRHDENILLYATQEYLSAPPDALARHLIDDYRRLARDKEVIMYVYVIDAENTLRGVVDIRELIMAEKDQTLDQIKTDHVISLDPQDTLSDALALFERYSFRAIPITDDANHLLGVVSQRDVRGLKPRLP